MIIDLWISPRIASFMPEFAQHMKPFVVLGRFASIASLFAVVGSAQALQISTPNSVVWLGRPFEIDVSLLADAPNEVAADCISVELFDGTNRIGPSRIRVAASDLGDGRKWRLSIRSSQAIEEPFVRLIVRLNCRQNLTREFVLLSEPFIERPSASIQRLAAPAEKAEGVGVAPVPDRASLPQRTVPIDSSPVVPTHQKKSVAPRSGEGSRSPVRPPSAEERATPKAGATSSSHQPRLKLQMLELPAADGEPRLRAASDLLTVPDEPGGERRKQARALWQTLNMTLEEIELQGARVQQLTAQSERLQRELGQARAEAAAWKQRAERSAEREPWLLAALGALGLVGAAFAGLWWRRREEASRALWWMPQEPTTSDSTREQEARSTGIAPGVETEREEAGQNGAQERRNAEKPAPAAAVLAEAPGKVQPIPPTPAGHAPDGPLAQARELAPSVADASELVRAVKVDELLDVEEEAEFFISLGQYDQAIAALHRHMAENPAASALVYLDLLGLYHRTGRKDAYEALRAKINATFNAEAPAFEDYVEGGNGLEACPRTLSRIQSLWPSPKVTGVIEESLFRPHTDDARRFDLEAYKDLLFLYAIAKELAKRDRAESPSSPDRAPMVESQADFQPTRIQPLAAEPAVDPVSSAPGDVPIIPASAHLGLDIDLAALDLDPPTLASQAAAQPGALAEPDSTVDSQAAKADAALDFELFLSENASKPGQNA
jgi:hypothetical protein